MSKPLNARAALPLLAAGATLAVPAGASAAPRVDAQWSFAPSGIAAGESITFDASASRGRISDPSGFTWDLGDGRVLKGERVSTAYPTAGTRRVVLTVKSTTGRTDSQAREVTVSAPASEPAQPQEPAPAEPAPEEPANGYALSQTSQFPGGVNVNSGSLTDVATGDSRLSMRAATTAGGATYARGIINRNPDGSRLSLGDGTTLSVGLSVRFRDTDRYVSVARFDNYDPYAGNGNIFGIERWSNDTLHVVSGRYDGTNRLVDLAAPGLTIEPNTRYDVRLEARLSSIAGLGYTRLYVNGNLVAQTTAANNYSGRSFTKLRAGLVANGGTPASLDFGALRLAVAGW